MIRTRPLAFLTLLAAGAGCQSVTTEESSFHLPDAQPGSVVDGELERLVERAREYPRVPDYHYKIAAIQFQKQNFKDSAASLRHAIDLEPEDSRYHYHLGRVYLNMRELDKAERSFRKAVSLASEERYSGPRAALAYVLAVRKKIPEAISQFEKCLVVEPENREFHFFLGVCHDIQRRPERAIHHLREYLDRGGLRYRKKAIEVLGHLGIIVDESALSPDQEPADAERLEDDLPPGIGEVEVVPGDGWSEP